MNLTFLFFVAFGGGEVDYTNRVLAPKYKADPKVTLWDRTRPDLVGKVYAYEVDWANKWPEAIGQSSWYSIVTNKKPAII